ncbi:uncharacterized protein RHOBADRAFT_36993 [Rhodotorula graminis WP1]|uniref:Nitrate reductase [NADPH] n=1 Tax=Rhodotorula graminis (strain WP1) TaxID=578459 RepID=A0A194S6G1_RHOGW|nr:uncharacterized protein RHOBADRAFT_36993 [Rhodotorula graminis WP1]KPV75001.1 hypothetical protein RHOBADRAFT_36993 [Rhodotorula graminis WP1]
MRLSPPPSPSTSSDEESFASTAATTRSPSPKLDALGGAGLPSPFYPPTLARQHSPDHLRHRFPLLPSTSNLPLEADSATKGTPDEWIPRDEALVRLTGRFPLNCEPSLPDLWAAGFLTPTRLHYVRNHGVVPRVTADEGLNWTLDVGGLCERPCTLTLADLVDPRKFKTVTLPVTLVCAGNRRKEQNVVRKSLGFSWGPAGLSTALYTGVYLADVLDYVRPRAEGQFGEPGYRRPEHVIFEGAEDLPNGKYGTSQRLRAARQKEKGMLLAWAHNGQALEPDHGFPLRLVVPGQIGGRSVKWLKKIEISDNESQHYLHFWDNKVLPTTLTGEEAREQRDWWHDPKYIINDLNVNAAIARPAHDEQLVVASTSPAPSNDSPSPLPGQHYVVEGYVYAGGGRRVTRVEVTLDDGASWSLAQLSYPEDAYRRVQFENKKVWGSFDMHERDESFCWAFYKLEVAVDKLADSSCVAVRAMDESLHLMGKTMYWNPTGMMNNWWFRVVIHRSINKAGETVLRFEHPTMPGLQPGGWMQRLKDDGLDPAEPTFTEKSSSSQHEPVARVVALKPPSVMIKPGVDRKITLAELKAHNTDSEPWFVVEGQVYDGAPFLKEHPGGAESITIVAGEDATEDFMAVHSIDARKRLADFHIGTLVVDEAPAPVGVAAAVTAAAAAAPLDPTFLSKSKWKGAKLVSIDYVNHDSRIYRFALEHPQQPLGLPVGQHVYARLRRKAGRADGGPPSDGPPLEGELVQRAYTPVSRQGAEGFLDLLIKVYFRTSAYPQGGKMSLGFEELQVGDVVEFKGPLGSFEWLGKGTCKWRGVERKVTKVGMICGGSGITPILQVLRGIVHDPHDATTTVHVLNANKTEADILMRAELDELEKVAGSTRYAQHLVLSQGPDDWPSSRGRIGREHLERHLPPPAKDALVLMCAPPAMQDMVSTHLAELGWDLSTQVVVF